MTEKERKIVLDRIKNDKKKIELREKQRERKIELESKEDVIKYLNILKELNILDNDLKYFETEQDIVKMEMIWAFSSRIKSEGILPCNHDIWMYCGSFADISRWYDDHSCIIKVDNEKKGDFVYNKYVCLECGKCLEIKEYEDFEENHFVLKNRKDICHERYMQLYYQLLYNHSVSKSRNLVIEEFYNNKNLPKKKTLEKNK